ncbi:C4-dicarboxylate ABC transporter permease [Actinobacteria bacterium YIM 96077]|uniref:C4-dicarboxylate ABC transporter permease n=2 Tax=Phytoactinopolyspora halophila TaxID=1981511 RepID=A0A329QZN9_9ACTN|nr:C4-dicarboxylate ABC transporter permease [Actinobacteria bacterium YIM 96077]RAW17697.1 C4-dicarboxylate ABC transporter permease [Phytoactinopolyspora halophila]
MFVGVAIGIVFGSLPGLTATLGVAVMLTFTFGMAPVPAVMLLMGVYAGGIYGGAISAILINTPGTPSSAATVLDGYALTRQGRAGEALRIATFATAFGGILSALVLLFGAPQLARVALEFGPAEFFALALFGLAVISGVSGGSLLKGLLMGILGLLISTVGLDPVGGLPRLTFGMDNLQGGVELIPALVGLFAIAELMRRAPGAHLGAQRFETADTPFPFTRAFRYTRTLVKSSAIGTFIGAIPGAGPGIASFLSYNEARRSSKNKEKFGKGAREGVAASEAGNNSATSATLIPLLTLGIPGDTVTAVLLGALALQGLRPGPELFVDHADIVYAIMLGLIIIQVMLYVQGRIAARLFARVATVPPNLLIPVLIVLMFVGAYSVNNTVFDTRVMMVFGLVGYIAHRFGFPVVPMLLGIVLGPIAETGFRQALLQSGGDPGVFFTRPLSLTFITLAVLLFVAPLIAQGVSRLRQRDRVST